MFAAWSTATELQPGPLAAISRQLARSAQLPAHHRSPKPTPGPGIGLTALILLTANDPVIGNEVLMRELMRCLRAIQAGQVAAGELSRARELAQVAQDQLTRIHAATAGVDLCRRQKVTRGSELWAAQMRANSVLEGTDPAAVEAAIATGRALAASFPDSVNASPQRSSGSDGATRDHRPRAVDNRRDRGPEL